MLCFTTAFWFHCETLFLNSIQRSETGYSEKSMEGVISNHEMKPSKFRRICVFCGSSQGKKKSYQDSAIELGKELVIFFSSLTPLSISHFFVFCVRCCYRLFYISFLHFNALMIFTTFVVCCLFWIFVFRWCSFGFLVIVLATCLW